MLKKTSLVVFNNGDVIAHISHNKCIEEYAVKHGVEREEAFSHKHVLSMLTLIAHDTARNIVCFGVHQKCVEILQELGITIE